MKDFEEILSQHDDLADFIRDGSIYLATDFNDFQSPSPEFLDWISPSFFKQYSHVLKHSLNEAPWKIGKLMSVMLICNEETKIKCQNEGISMLTEIVRIIGEISDEIVMANHRNLDQLTKFFTKDLMEAFNALPPSEVALNKGLEAALFKMLGRYERVDHAIKDSAFQRVIRRIATPASMLTYNVELSQRLTDLGSSYVKEETKKLNKTNISAAIILLWIILRFIARCS